MFHVLVDFMVSAFFLAELGCKPRETRCPEVINIQWRCRTWAVQATNLSRLLATAGLGAATLHGMFAGT